MKYLALVTTAVTCLLVVVLLDRREVTAAAAAPPVTTSGVSIASIPLEYAFSATFNISTFPQQPTAFSWPSTDSRYLSNRVFEGPIDPGYALVLTRIQAVNGGGTNNYSREFAVGIDGNPVYFGMRAIDSDWQAMPPMQPIVLRENQILRIEVDTSGTCSLMLQGYLVPMALL